MDTQKLYELLSKQLTEMDARFTQRTTDVETRLTQQIADVDAKHTKQFESLDARLESLDARFRNVEVHVGEIKGRKPRLLDRDSQNLGRKLRTK